MADFSLASASPRRKAFLAEAGYRFAVVVSEVEEVPAPNEAPLAYALRVAESKARAAQALNPALPALGADTDVVLAGRILGKPVDAADAAAMLAALAGQTHEVVSAVVLVHGARIERVHTITEVQFTALSVEEIARYIASGEPFGKAGAYAIQGLGARHVARISGSYTGVVGLPLAETCALLARFGIQPAQT